MELKELKLINNKYSVRDLWEKENTGSITNLISFDMNKHSARLLKLSN
ncbi:MAG: hypothetical protein H6613_03100 [Ignavibacteriales bacterium]|nr:hypothetical protein [Ignavibacteriales bacterium]